MVRRFWRDHTVINPGADGGEPRDAGYAKVQQRTVVASFDHFEAGEVVLWVEKP